MTGPEHYQHAEQLLDAAYAEECDSAYHRHLIGAATVHATLAVAAALSGAWAFPQRAAGGERR